MIIKKLLAVSALAVVIGFSTDRVEAATPIYSGETVEIVPLETYEANVTTSDFAEYEYAYYNFDSIGIFGNGSAEVLLNTEILGGGIGWYIPGEEGDLLSEFLFFQDGVTEYTLNTSFDPLSPDEYPSIQQFRLFEPDTVPETDVASITFTFTEVPEIDATAGMGSLAALGAMLAFCRSRRRSA